MRLRTSLLAASIVLTGYAGSATAAPPCNLILDASGDAVAVAGPSDDSLDVVSADIASDKKTLTAVIRIKKLAHPNPTSPIGQSYFVLFSAAGAANQLFVSAGLYATGNQFLFGYQGVDPLLPLNTSYTLGSGTGTVDMDKSELRISVPLEAFKEQADLKPGKKLSGLIAEGRKVFGQRVIPSQQVGPARAPLGGLTLTADTAEATKGYVLGAKNCVEVGK
ncbi:MAG TPA: hypothetical protein VNA14_02545 [Mycobacteriales bacterium]|nr:hypothetical protein [Mycobacteriales bacterium]